MNPISIFPMKAKVSSFITLSTSSIIVAIYFLSSAHLSTLILRVNDIATINRNGFDRFSLPQEFLNNRSKFENLSLPQEILKDWTRPSSCPSLFPRNLNSARIDPLLTLNYSISDAFQHLLLRYVAWHEAVGRQGPLACVPILVWSCNPGVGLGDQVRGAHHALMLAMETGRYLVLRPPLSAALVHAFEPSRINWQPHAATKIGDMLVQDIWRLRKLPQLRSAAIFEKIYGSYHVVELTSHGIPKYERLVGTKWFLENCIGKEKPKRCSYKGSENLDVNRLVHMALFRHKHVDLQKAHSLSKLHGLISGNYIAIHARVGGDLDKNHHRFRKIHENPGFYEKELSDCVAKIAPGIRNVYVASDDEMFKMRIVEELIARNMTAFPSTISAGHTRNGLKWDERNERIVRNSTAEALVLGDAKILVTMGSGFSFLAAFGGRSKLVYLNECGKHET